MMKQDRSTQWNKDEESEWKMGKRQRNVKGKRMKSRYIKSKDVHKERYNGERMERYEMNGTIQTHVGRQRDNDIEQYQGRDEMKGKKRKG